MIKRFKNRRLVKQLEALYEKTPRRRHNMDRFRSFYDFLTAPEQLRYSALARAHYLLNEGTDDVFLYFDPRRDAVKNEPNSPIGMLTVDHDQSSTVEIFSVPFENDSLDFVVRNGELEAPSWATDEQIEFVLEKWNATK